MKNALDIINKPDDSMTSEERKELARTTFRKIWFESQLTYSHYYQLLYLSSLEYRKQRITKLTPYDGEKKILDDIIHKEKIQTIREFVNSFDDTEKEVIEDDYHLKEKGLCLPKSSDYSYRVLTLRKLKKVRKSINDKMNSPLANKMKELIE